MHKTFPKHCQAFCHFFNFPETRTNSPNNHNFNYWLILTYYVGKRKYNY